MQKKFFMGLIALAVLVCAGYGVKSSMSSDAVFATISLAEIEAVAQVESGDGWIGISCGQTIGYCLRWVEIGNEYRQDAFGNWHLWNMWDCVATGDPNDWC
jgi:acetyl-CoA acetyltransferase